MAIPEFLIEKLESQYGNELKEKILEGFIGDLNEHFRPLIEFDLTV